MQAKKQRKTIADVAYSRQSLTRSQYMLTHEPVRTDASDHSPRGLISPEYKPTLYSESDDADDVQQQKQQGSPASSAKKFASSFVGMPSKNSPCTMFQIPKGLFCHKTEAERMKDKYKRRKIVPMDSYKRAKLAKTRAGSRDNHFKVGALSRELLFESTQSHRYTCTQAKDEWKIKKEYIIKAVTMGLLKQARQYMDASEEQRQQQWLISPMFKICGEQPYKDAVMFSVEEFKYYVQVASLAGTVLHVFCLHLTMHTHTHT